jgi:hypothetical protein
VSSKAQVVFFSKFFVFVFPIERYFRDRAKCVEPKLVSQLPKQISQSDQTNLENLNIKTIELTFVDLTDDEDRLAVYPKSDFSNVY